MQKLVDMIKLAKQGNNEAVMYIIEKFTPLIEKYTRLLDYDEDSKSELILKLICLVRKEIDLVKLRNHSDGVLVNYISCAIHNYYIKLSIAKRNAKNYEISFDPSMQPGCLEEDVCCFYDIEYKFIIDFLRESLTEREFMCVKLIVLDGWTAEAVAKKAGVSKQAINQCKIRALSKLRNLEQVK